MTDNTMREAFEHHVRTKTLMSLEKFNGGAYRYNSTELAWETWQAAQSEQSVPVMGEPPENAAKSIASMIEEWVQECIKKNGNWQERLPTLIQSRLKRFWPARSIPAAELDAKDARIRELEFVIEEIIRINHYDFRGHEIAHAVIAKENGK